MQLDHQAGIVINQLKVIDNNNIKLDILRDPDAVNVVDWLKDNKLEITQLTITERSFYSLDPDILVIRAQKILAQYPIIESHWQDNKLILTGTLELIKTEKLLTKLSIAGFVDKTNLNTEQLHLTTLHSPMTSDAIKQQLFDELIGRISAIQLDFTVASEKITPQMQLSLQRLYLYVQQLSQLAAELDMSYGLLIMGTSDSSGIKAANNQLSIRRAKNTSDILESLGVKRERMYVTGLGQIDISEIRNTSRKVMFNIIVVSE
jgi:outer membrane protein OmpA-like peptidoglycan-associated protein